MDHPVALVLVAGVQVIVANVEELLDVVRKLVQKRIAVPDLVENHEREFVGARRRHIRLRGKQWT